MYYRWDRGDHAQLTRYFNTKDFECRCGKCKTQRIAVELVYLLDIIRSEVKKPVNVTSGFRCKDHQEDLKKHGYSVAENSQHLLGAAADISSDDLNLLYKFADRRFDAIGDARHSSKYIHVDLRRDQKRRWKY